MSEWVDALNGFASTWATALGRASWQGGVAITLVWTVSRAAPRLSPRVRCWLWRLVYLKLLVALCWATPVDLPLLPPRSLVPVPFPPVPYPAGLTPSGEVLSRLPSSEFSIACWLLFLWLLGLFAVGGWIVTRWRATQRLQRSYRMLDDTELHSCCAELCQRLGLRQAPRLMVAEGIAGPMLIGLARPVIVLPTSLLGAWTSLEQRLVLAHELAHLKRRDLLWGWLPLLAHVCFFFHPLVWLAHQEFRLARELACDEIALQVTRARVGDYGSMLLKVAAPRWPGSSAELGAAHVVESYQMLKRRLLAMQHLRPVASQRWRSAGVALAVLSVVGIVPWRVVAGGEITYIDLQPHANQKLTANFQGNAGSGNDLAGLPKGEQTLAGVRFRVGDACIQLGSPLQPNKPFKVEGIRVNRRMATLFILHATGWGNAAEGSRYHVADDTLIGEYTLHYDDGSREVIPIVYGKDVRDWWAAVGAKGVTRGQVAWTGQNEVAKSFGAAMIRLYLTAWKNPRPQRKVVRIDYSSTQTSAAPFCVAMSGSNS